MTKGVDLKCVETGRTLRDFLRVPWSIYHSDPAWVPPLLFERRQALARKHPFFQHAEWQGWVAYRGATPVGRISAQVDALHQEQHGDRSGYFGMLEAIDDDGVFATLFGAAEQWLIARGMRRAVGPFSLGINQEIGLLVEGFETPPYFLMGHAPRYYSPRVESQGYRHTKDLLAYDIIPAFPITRVMSRLMERMHAQGIVVRTLNRKRLADELESLRVIFNDAWSDNWGFVPFTYEEFQAVGKELTLLLPGDFIQIAEVDGEPAAFMVMLPNLNEAIRDLDGRLAPFGWVKLLWRLFVRFPSTARIPLMGVRKQYQNTRLGPGLAFMVIHAMREPALRKGVKLVEMSWILEDNTGMRNIIESIGGRVSKRYRMYEKRLA